MSVPCGVVQGGVSSLWFLGVDERRVVLEEGDHFVDGGDLILLGGFDEHSLPGARVTREHLVQEHAARSQVLVSTRSFVVKL